MKNVQHFVMMVIVASATVLFAQPAPAQSLNLAAPDKPVTREEVEKKEQQERAYRESLQKIPDQKVVNDPWGGVRETGPSAAGRPQQKSR